MNSEKDFSKKRIAWSLVRLGVTLRRRNRERQELREIKTLQKSVNLLIRKKRFRRLVKGLAQKYNTSDFDSSAMEAMQEASEDFLVRVFQGANLSAIHAERDMIMPHDMRLALELGALGLGSL